MNAFTTTCIRSLGDDSNVPVLRACSIDDNTSAQTPIRAVIAIHEGVSIDDAKLTGQTTITELEPSEILVPFTGITTGMEPVLEAIAKESRRADRRMTTTLYVTRTIAASFSGVDVESPAFVSESTAMVDAVLEALDGDSDE
jgi:hypothetical protein